VIVHSDLPMMGRGRSALSESAFATLAGQTMLTAADLCEALRQKPTTQAVARMRSQRVLIGLANGPGYLFPAFQVDGPRGRVRPEVAERNRRLLLVHDEWAALEWWFTSGRKLLPDHLLARP
jgi:hypothetical protein